METENKVVPLPYVSRRLPTCYMYIWFADNQGHNYKFYRIEREMRVLP